MKLFKNKVTEIDVPDMDHSTNKKIVYKKATYVDLSLIILRSSKREGFSIEDMRKRFRVIDALADLKETDTVELEDADAQTLQTLTAEYKWEVMDKQLIDFVDYIAELPKATK